MVSVFWDALKIIFFDYLEKGKPIIIYITAFLSRLKIEITKKTLHDNNKSALSPSQRTVSQVDGLDGKTELVGLRIAPLFFRSAPSDYWLFASQ